MTGVSRSEMIKEVKQGIVLPLILILAIVALALGTFSVIDYNQINTTKKTNPIKPKSDKTIDLPLYTIETYSFKTPKTQDLLDEFKLTDNFISSNNIEPVVCLFNNDVGGRALNRFKVAPEDAELADNLTKIEEYEFSDERQYRDIDGKKIIENQGKRSKREINYFSICKNNNQYFVVFNAALPKRVSIFGDVYAAGGVDPPSHLAYFNGNSFEIYENIPGDYVYGELESAQLVDSAYFGCRTINGTKNNNPIVGCGGGDGCCGSAVLYEFDLHSQKMKQMVACIRDYLEPENESRMRCFEESGKIYYEKKNKF